jgi:hypothetical protein
MGKKEKAKDVESPEDVLYRFCDRIDEFVKKCEDNKLNPNDPTVNAFLTVRISDLVVVAKVLDHFLADLEVKAEPVREDLPPKSV